MCVYICTYMIHVYMYIYNYSEFLDVMFMYIHVRILHICMYNNTLDVRLCTCAHVCMYSDTLDVSYGHMYVTVHVCMYTCVQTYFCAVAYIRTHVMYICTCFNERDSLLNCVKASCIPSKRLLRV